MNSKYPIDLVLVRHGESEGNLAQQLSKQGDDCLWTEDFSKRHTSRYRLTEKGVEQAQAAAKWIKENVATSFDRYYCSEYIRAMETATILDFEGAEWYLEFFLREQDKGCIGGHSIMQREENYKTLMQKKNYDAFYWAPPGGESIATACLRVEKFLETLRTSCSGFRVIVVCHGNILLGFRVRLERMNQDQYRKWQKDPSPKSKFHNCQILHYSRRDPVTKRVSSTFEWVRSICPWDLSKSNNEWTQINRPTFTNEQMREHVEKVRPLVSHARLNQIMEARKKAEESSSDDSEKSTTEDDGIEDVDEERIFFDLSSVHAQHSQPSHPSEGSNTPEPSEPTKSCSGPTVCSDLSVCSPAPSAAASEVIGTQ
jgi:broad specificity phosphatase PhoE